MIELPALAGAVACLSLTDGSLPGVTDQICFSGHCARMPALRL